MVLTDGNQTKFYAGFIKLLKRYKFQFLIGGGLSVTEQSSVNRPMKDLDVFVKAGDFPRILNTLKDNGYKTSIPDERWLAKASKDGLTIDLIFSSYNYQNHVDDSWFENSKDAKLFGQTVKLVGAEEIIWCKAFVQDRTWYDGADINHIILSQGNNLNWKRLLHRMENYWELLFSIILNFRFVYPSERGIVPKWLMQELISRLEHQLKNPIPKDKICRGPLLSRTQYQVDLREGGFEFIA